MAGESQVDIASVALGEDDPLPRHPPRFVTLAMSVYYQPVDKKIAFPIERNLDVFLNISDQRLQASLRPVIFEIMYDESWSGVMFMP